uniref:6-phosphogluconolactonase n=1 Tax=Magnetococcus massalia (strain MO-1) TaxID=451514 RepID=A0A1S7LDT7_MAGMO|nr:6-phosphogluconolactonase [Candidatus Magnetococcus massalia]
MRHRVYGGPAAMDNAITMHADPQAAAMAMAAELLSVLNQHGEARPFRLALSGGSTPKMLYSLLGQSPLREQLPWHKLEIFWVDERCVAPNDPQSNHGMFMQAMGEKLPLESARYHRMQGEAEPEQEALRYGQLLPQQLDWIWLGLGGDGHTASLFPGYQPVADEPLCLATRNPHSGQNRMTLSETAIVQALRVTFLVTGAEKAPVLTSVIQDATCNLPAARIAQQRPVDWVLDEPAGKSFMSLSPPI